ncbi:MAG: hypothetical protein N3F64_05290 [Nitrososphaeria archaeon]|nr:hypothetical protein [Nitrososphaeria archaeon]
MPDITMSHLVGTLLLAMLLSAVTFFSLQTTMDTSIKSSKIYLQEVCERVSSEMMDMLNLFYLEHKSPYIYKIIEIPVHVNNKGYIIKLENDSLGWKVVSYVYGYEVFKVESRLYIKSGVEVVNYSGSFKVSNGKIVYDTLIHSGVSKPVVWCRLNPNTGSVQVGIGRLEVSG